MAFLGLNLSVLTLIQQRSTKQFRMMVRQNELNQNTEVLNAIANANADNDDYNVANDPAAQQLQQNGSNIEAEIASLETELTVLNQQIKDNKNAAKQNAKSDMKLNIN